MHADRTNRIALALLGLLLLSRERPAITASAGVDGAAFSRRTLFANPASTYIGHHGGWLWPAVAAACLLLALACLRWLLALLVSTDRARDLTVPGPADQGTTTLQPAALTGALSREIGTYHGVETARAGSSETATTRTSCSPLPQPRPPTCTHCTAASKPKPSPTPGRPSAIPPSPSSSTSSSTPADRSP